MSVAEDQLICPVYLVVAMPLIVWEPESDSLYVVHVTSS